jgi:pilus assembly protein FimV
LQKLKLIGNFNRQLRVQDAKMPRGKREYLDEKGVRMVRKLVKTLLSISLLAPAAALALGLGDVQLHSALNQRLDADIKLLSVNPEEADTVKVSLASYEDFAKVGLERPATLMFLRFNVEQAPSGDYSIKLTSKEVIREPFLDFLIEVKWRSGRVLREYTLLLDPPVSHREAAPAITAPSATAATAPAPAPAEDEFVPPPSSIPVAPGVTAPPAVTARAPAPQAATVPAQPSMPAGGIVYGPVKSDDTLWRIAQKLRPSSDISVQQMMLALLKANPYAFFDNNINRLKKGFVLRIDDPAMISAMNKAEAAREVSRQTRAWQDYRAAVAEKAKKRAPVATTEAPAGAVATAKKEPKLELVAPDGKAEQPGKATEGAESVQKDLMLALESSAAQRKENEELQKRVQGLEEQLQDMQRLLTLKDSDLAALQKQLREQGQAVSLPSEKAEPAEKPLVVKPEQQAAGEEAMPAVTGEKPAEAMPEPKAAEEKKPEPVTKPAPKKPMVKKPAPQPPVVEEPSIVDILMDNLSYLLLGLVGLLVLVILGIWLKRRRGGGFQESILSGGTSSMLEAKEGEMGAETSFLSDLAVSGMGGGAIHSDEGEVDPLTEADVFMAYGRNQQAEEVLKKALEKNPERQDLTAKLLEVYYNLKDSAQFVALAEGAEEALKGDEELWGKVAAMGHELSPDNGLFALAEGGEAPAVAAPVEKPEPVSEDVLDIGLDLDELTAEMENEGAAEEFGFDLGLDFGDLEEEEKAAAEAEQPAEAEEPIGFDLDLGATEEVAEAPAEESAMDFDLDLGAEAAEEAAPAEEAGELDLDLGALEAAEEEAPAEEAGELDLDLGALEAEEEQPSEEIALDLGGEAGGEEELSMDFDLGAVEEESPAAAEEELDMGELGDIDFGDLGLESTEAEAAPPVEAAEEESGALDLSDLEDFGELGDLGEEGMLGDSDEIATKLDLAQAYIEMGDNDGARSMLEEVAEAGNDEQKQQAQELLSKI